ncbi:MAG: PIG-L family deacetylase [Chloroflexi bacterium]|nr:PIG-L family deacetylase [Chloroflexota bacterium]
MADKPVRIMVVGAHPADPFERAGGTVAKHLARGDQAMLVSLTYGVVTHAFTLFPRTGEDKLRDIDKIKAMKAREFEEASQILGATEHRLFDWAESPMIFGMEEYKTLINLIREFRPDVVLCPHPVEVGRHDHMETGRFTIAAVDYARADGFPSPLAPHAVPHIFMFYYEDYRSEQLMGASRHTADLIVDTTEVIDKKKAAMTIFGSTQTKRDEDYGKKLDDFMVRVDGNVGYLHGFGYGEQFTRWHPQRVKYLPVG